MSTLEERMAQPPAPGQKSEEEGASIEGSVVEAGEANITPESVEDIAAESATRVEKAGEETVQEGRRGFESAVDAGSKLGLSEQEITQVSGETQVGEALQAIQAKVDALTGEAKRKIEGVAAIKPGSPEDGKEKKETEKALEQKEKEYLAKKLGKAKGLDGRYGDERASAENIQKQVAEYVSGSGLKRESIPTLENQKLDPETKKIIQDLIKSNLDTLFLNKEKGRHNPEKHEIMMGQTERFLSLLEQAQSEGDISKDLSASEIFKLVERNVEMMTFQDRVASENMLGDHGVRHVVGFNIKMTEQMLDSLAEKGQEVRAIDRIMGHQIMLMHDLGYATDPVREEVNKGNLPADKGHNLLSAKILRQMGENPEDALSKIFSKEQLAVLHEGVLEHDDSKVEFHVNDGNPTSRKENLLSAIHLADNTHAFEDKLPELLYSVPESLKAMRLLKTAGEIGDKGMIENVKNKLVADIKSNENYSEDDKEALVKAVGGLGESSYKFSVGRICGNKPEVSIGQNGKVSIKVQESTMHQEAVGLFGLQSYDQLKKFIGDLEGKEKDEITNEMLNQERIEGKNVTIELALGGKKSTEKTDYQKRIESIVTDKKFVEFSRKDLILSRRQKALENRMKAIKEKGDATGEGSTKLAKMEEDIDRYKTRRRAIYSDYEKS